MTQRITKSLNTAVSFFILATMLIGVVRMPTSASAQANLQQNDLRIDYSAETGKASFIGAEPGKAYPLDGVAMESLAPQDRPMMYIEHFGELLGLEEPGRELSRQFSRSRNGRSTTRYQQVYGGIPIMAGELIVNLDARGSLLSISGEISPDLSLSTKPEVAAEDARATALHAVAKIYNLDAAGLTTTEPELWVFDERLLRPSTRPAELVWRMDVVARDELQPIRELVLVNAVRGGISLHFNQIDTTWGEIHDEPLETPIPTPTPTVEPTELATPEPTPVAVVPAETIVPTPTARPSLPDESDEGINEPLESWGEGDEYYVKPGGDDGLDCDTPADACETISGAMGKATSGDTIYIASGTYTGSGEYVVSFDKNLLLSGGWEMDFSSQTGFSIIDGEDARKGVEVGGGRIVELEYIRIENGYATGAGNTGGAIVTSGDLTLRHCILTNNEADFNGGGIYQTGTLVIEYSELSNNHSGDTGGAMIVVSGTVDLRNVTVSGNSSSSNAGGIFNAGALTLNNVTMANNSTNAHGGGLISGVGGTVTMSNTVLADNSTNFYGPDCYAPTVITTLGYNLIEDTAECSFTPATGDITGVDPGLAALEGSPAYYPFGSSSALTDAGNPATPGGGGGACETEDQRGNTRPIDGDNNGSSFCDIGAVEIIPTVPDSIEAYAGTPQQADLLTTFGDPLQARVLDNYGSPMEGETVTFTAPATGASGTFTDSGTHETTAVTAADGIATAADFTANDVEGAYIVEAAVSGVATPAEFSLENFDVFAVSIDVNAGSGQITEVSTTFSTQLQALVQDQYGSPLEGAIVTFTAPTSGASGTFADSLTNETTAVTDSDGLATAADFTANGEAGSYIVEASVVGVETQAEFSLGNYISTPSSIQISAGSGQDTEVLTTFAIALRVLVKNQYGDPFEGASVTFTAPPSGASGTFAASGTNETTVITGADGLATASTFTANGDAGLYIVEASVDGESLSVDFNLENFVRTPTSMEEVAGSHQNVEPLITFTVPFQVLVRDQLGDPVDGVTVTFTAPASGASGTFADSLTNETTAVTNGSGIATAAAFTANDQEGVYVVLATVVGVSSPVEFNLANFISSAWYVSNDGNDSYDCRSPATTCATINSAINKATSGETIYIATGTYTGDFRYVVDVDKDILLMGGWESDFGARTGFSTIDAENTRLGMEVIAGITVEIEYLLFEDGSASMAVPNGGGIMNAGNLTMRYCIVRDNDASNYGGGVYHEVGTLIVENSEISQNHADVTGGGVYIASGTAEIRNSTISDNFADVGGGIYNAGTLTLNNATIYDNLGFYNGGGIFSEDVGTTTMSNTALAENNTYGYGPDCQAPNPIVGLGYNLVSVTAECGYIPATGDILNVHIFLRALEGAPAYHGFYDSDCELVDTGNPAAPGSGGGACEATDQRGLPRPFDGDENGSSLCDIGAFELMVGTADTVAVYAGSSQQTSILTTFNDSLQALVLDNFGLPLAGETVTFTAPASGASGTFTDSGTNVTTAVSDEDGIATAVDFTANDIDGVYNVEATVGGVATPAEFALENYLPIATAIEVYSGSGQTAAFLSTFTDPLQALVRDQFDTPMGGVTVTFSAPASGASGTFVDSLTYETTALTDVDGIATAADFTANDQAGDYTVLATFSGGPGPAEFDLTNRNPIWYVAADGDDLFDCRTPATACASIMGALDKPDFRYYDEVRVGASVSTNSTANHRVLYLPDSVTIRGGWDDTFTTQSGYTVIDGGGINQGIRIYTADVLLERLIIQNAGPNEDNDGSGINSYGNLTLVDCIVRNNRSSDEGGGIYYDDSLILENTLVINNTAIEGGGGLFGGQNTTLILNNSAIVNNTTFLTGGGGLYTFGNGISVILNNSTVAGNQAPVGGGIYFDDELILNSSSIVGNTATYRGGGFEAQSGALATIQNSLLADNSAQAGQNCSGTVVSDGYNLVDSTSGCDFTSSTGDILDVGAQLGTLVSSQGYVPLLSGSPAIEGGNPAGCEDHEGSSILVDQRGVTRSGVCDIGAYEYMLAGTHTGIQANEGDGQKQPPGMTYPQNLVAFVHDGSGNPVAGITVTFDAPGSGASGTFSDTLTNTTTAVTGIDGMAMAAPFTANSVQGAYVVTASISSPSAYTEFNLENLVWYVSPDGANYLDCRQIATACATIEGVLSKPGFVDGNTIFVESGTYTEAETPMIQLDRDVEILGGWNADFTVQDGYSSFDCEDESRRGIFIYGVSVKADHMVVENCNSNGIRNVGAAELDHFIVRDNEAGGITNDAYLEIQNCSIRGNTASDGGGIQSGYFGTITIIKNCFIQENTSTDNYHGGGGIYTDEILHIENSTISGNTAASGGGIFLYYGAEATINNTTITNNTATYNYGGGIAGWGTARITNSLIAGNLAPTYPDCYGSYEFVGHNIYGYPETCSYTDDDIVSVEPLLVPQLVNGGPDVIYALRPRSQAIDAANPAAPGSGGDACLETDQRGVARPLDGDENGTSICDIGAYELDPADPPVIPDPGPEGARRTYTSDNTTWYPGYFLCDETQPNCTDGADTHADAAHAFAGDTYAFYDSHHGRDSFDNAGGIIISSVHVGSGYANAAWTGRQMIYGDAYGFPLADDVVAHELTHGVTDYASNLFYYYQSGAINESFSDLWGEFVDLTNGTGNDDPGVRWLLGEDVAGSGAMRDMADPTTFNDPDSMTSHFYDTGNADLYNSSGDSGGVHTNSGVNNKAVYLMTDGDSFNGQTVTGLGIDKVAAIYYEVQTNLLTSGADYGDLYNALYQGCLNLIGGAEGITAGDCMEVQQAALAVEMNQEPVLGYNPDVGLCDSPGSVPIALFADDIESGTANWAPGYESGGDQWDLTATWYATSGTHSLYGDDYYYDGDYPWPLMDSYIAMVVDVPLESGSQPYLHFNHAFGFEQPDYDGGWLEYSIDGGSIWIDAGALYDDGLDYTGSINTINGDGDNLHTGREAFVGDSHGYVSSRYDLGSLAGQSVRFRWRMSTDSLFYDWGWWVDDVRIYTCRLMGDFDGDGEPDIGDYRPSNGRWYLKDLIDAGYGFDGSISSPSDYAGDVDIAVDRSSNDRWYLEDQDVVSEGVMPEDDVTDFVEGANEFGFLEETIQAIVGIRTSQEASSPGLRTLLLPFSRFLGDDSGQIYNTDGELPSFYPEQAVEQSYSRRIVERMLQMYMFQLLFNTLLF